MISRFSRDRTVHRTLSRGVRPIAAAMIAAGTASALLIVAGCSPDTPTPDTPPNRVLQSVNVQMTPDGTTTAIDGTSVAVRDNAADATTQETTYSPQAVNDDLPARVTASYRTAKRSGTDLSDLKGYTGHVEIDLTVQNLTMKPKDLTYDVAGTSKTQSALVGSPLTVVASATLPKTTPTDVVTASAPGDSSATNGVLSQGDKGGSVVQWATLLAPPQTGANATLRLVADAKDFQVPNFDLSVQPGLVTDPSVSGVLESAFNPDPQSQLALEQRTIKVITQVNDTLTRASDNISDVRKNLQSTSNTLGTRSLQELKTSTKGVANSMKGLDKELTGLNKDISSTVSANQSSVLQQLDQTVGAMDQMLGDTSATPPAPKIDGEGCKTVVESPKQAGTVYGNLMQVTAQLDGYATATKQCKKNAQAALLRSVGPTNPTEKNCAGQQSTTCALYATEQKFGAIMETLVAQGDDLVSSLQPEVVNDAMDQYRTMSKNVDSVQKATRALTKFDPYEDVDSRLKKVNDKLDDVDTQVDQVSDQVELIHNEAVSAGQYLDNIGAKTDDDHDGKGDTDEFGEPRYTRGSMLAQNEALAEQLCALPKRPLFHGISDQEVNALRAYLVNRSCPVDDDHDGKIDPVKTLGPPPGYANSMEERLLDLKENQQKSWDKVATWSDVHDDSQGVGKQLSDVRGQLDSARSRVKSVQAAVVTGKKDLSDLTLPLTKSVDSLSDNRDALGDDLKTLKKQQDGLAPKINKAFNNAADDANKQVSDAIDPQIRKVTTQAKVDSTAVGEMFDKSAAGLSNAADQITSNGTRTIDNQRRALKQSEKLSSSDAAKQVNQSLNQMAKGVSASNRDMNSASAQLADSLNKVLLDLGTRKVNGSGLLGSMTTGAAKVGSADYQLALASGTTTSYANVRSEDINGILLRQAQLQASLKAGAELPAFHLKVPSGAQSQTVYTFRIEEAK